MNVERYSVFASAGHPDGGKLFAVVQESVAESAMPELARSSGAPLTVFLLEHDSSRASVRFFAANGKEKPESDSGALVVAQVLGSSCMVDAPGGSLQVLLEDGLCWSAQGDHHLWPLDVREVDCVEALGLNVNALDTFHKVGAAGNAEKQNLVVPLRAEFLDGFRPNFERVAELNAATNTNGLVVVAFDSVRANLDLRFFAPRKGILEDNAGSFTLASVCGFRAMYTASGRYEWTALQGVAMGKPSALTARLIVRDSVAMAVQVGGRVVRVQA